MKKLHIGKHAAGAGRVGLLLVGLWWAGALGAAAAPFTVTNTADSGPGTLRWAITNANRLPDLDEINFNIPGPGPHTIQVSSPLAVTNPVVINGYSQPGARSNTLAVGNNALLQIRLSGGGTVPIGLHIQDSWCAVYGLAIHGFTAQGIAVDGGTNTVIQGNFIGVDVDGLTAPGNGGFGIFSTASRTIIGGPLPWQRNIISGNREGGIRLRNSAASLVQGNYIGTDATGITALGNGGNAIEIQNPTSRGILVGGSAPGEGNVIAAAAGTNGNNHGIYIFNAHSNRIEGNFIGTDPTGTRPLGNLGCGIHLTNATVGNVVGGPNAGAGNVIAYNALAGVWIASGTNAVLGNLIFANGEQAIDIGPRGPAGIDPGDTDDGPNGLQNAPQILQAEQTANGLQVTCLLDTMPNRSYRIEFFAGPACGQAVSFLGAVERMTDASGFVSFSETFAVGNLAGPYVMATATDPFGCTSEFSDCQPTADWPTIFDQSVGPLIALQGDPVTLWVRAGGTPPVRYQWKRDGVAVPDATNTTFTIAAALPPHAGRYEVEVSNLYGSVTSQPIGLMVLAPRVPELLAQPQSATVNVGATVNLSVSASSIGPCFFQWRLNGVNIEGATNATLTLTNVQATNSGAYSVVVYNSAGAVSSAEAVLTVQVPALSFKDNFVDLTKLTSETGAGRSSNTLATVQAGEPLHAGKPGGKSVWIMWQAPKSGIATFTTAGSTFDTVLAVYTGTALTNLVEVASDDDSGGFLGALVRFNAVQGKQYVIAVDGFGGASGSVVLSWRLEVTPQVLPVIVAHPNSQTVAPGGTAIFTVGASGANLNYQWFFNGQPIPGATRSELVLAGVGEAQVGKYSVVVSNAWRAVKSHRAALELAWADTGTPRAKSAGKFLDAVRSPHRMELGGPGELSRTVRRLLGGGTVTRGYTGTQVFSTYGQTKEPGEPNHCGIAGGASSWFVLTTATNGLLRIDTEGSDFDTVLAVYTGPGTDFASLVPVACDNNSGADGRDSKVIFAAQANTTYFIAVDGVGGASGRVKLNYVLGQPPVILTNPACARIAQGGTATLQVAAQAIPAACYQWFRQGVPVPHGTNACLTLTNFQPDQAGDYCVNVSNPLGQAISRTAQVRLAGALRLSHQGRRDASGFHLAVEGAAYSTYLVEASTNLQTWVPLATNFTATGLWMFMDPRATNYPHRYYRVRVAP